MVQGTTTTTLQAPTTDTTTTLLQIILFGIGRCGDVDCHSHPVGTASTYIDE